MSFKLVFDVGSDSMFDVWVDFVLLFPFSNLCLIPASVLLLILCLTWLVYFVFWIRI